MKIVEGKNEAIVMKALKDKNVDMIISLEKNFGKDFMDNRNSGLNQVLCKLANKNRIVIGFNFDDVFDSNNRGLILGKMMQNVKFCRKYKVNMFLYSKKRKSLNDLKSFGFVIGMNPSEIKKAVKFVKKQRDIEILD